MSKLASFAAAATATALWSAQAWADVETGCVTGTSGSNFDTAQTNCTAVPEPSTLGLFALAAVAAVAVSRMRR